MQPQYNGPAVVVQSPVNRKYPLNGCVVGIGIALIVIGLLSIGAQIAGTVIEIGLGEAGAGIWSGVFFVVTGSFGIIAGKTRTKCQVVTFMILSIICASAFAAALLTIAAIGLENDDDDYDYCDYYWWWYRSCEEIRWGLGLNSTMIAFAVAAGVLSIVGSALTCRAFCCQKSNNTVIAHQSRPMQPQVQQPMPQYVPQAPTAGPSDPMILIQSQDFPGYYRYVPNPAFTGAKRDVTDQRSGPPGYDNLTYAEAGELNHAAVHQPNALKTDL